MDDTHPSSMTYTAQANGATVTANLANAYTSHHTQVSGWTRTFTLNGDVLSIHDVCTVAAGVKPIFQLHVPVQPVAQGDGSTPRAEKTTRAPAAKAKAKRNGARGARKATSRKPRRTSATKAKSARAAARS